MIVLAYLWPLALVPLLVEKNDPDVQWHAKHGLVLMIAELILIFGYIMMTSIVSLATLGLGCVLSLFLVFGWVAILALHVVAILKGVSKRYGAHVVYDNFDFEVHRGERWCVMGVNGAGKSTLLKMVAGVIAPDAGTVRLGASLKLDYFSQSALEILDANKSV